MPKKYKPSVKFKIVLEAIKTDKAVAEVARNFDVHPNTVRNWIEKFEENGQEVFSEDSEVKELEEKVAELERLVGQKEREIAILKNFLGNLD